VGMKVLLAHDGDDWEHKCWFARGMSAHKSAGSPKGMFYPSSAGTQTCVKTIEKCHRFYCAINNSGLLSFVFVRTVLALIKHRFHVPTCRVNV
jgi:hypothetical protein